MNYFSRVLACVFLLSGCSIVAMESTPPIKLSVRNMGLFASQLWAVEKTKKTFDSAVHTTRTHRLVTYPGKIFFSKVSIRDEEDDIKIDGSLTLNINGKTIPLTKEQYGYFIDLVWLRNLDDRNRIGIRNMINDSNDRPLISSLRCIARLIKNTPKA